jgi:hypothetical protein
MKSTFLKAAKTVALSLSLMLAASGAVFANGAGAPPTAKVALNGAGNGAGTSTTWNKKKTKRKRLVRRTRRARNGAKTA